LQSKPIIKLKVFGYNKTLVKYISASYLAIPVSLITGFIAFRNIDPYFMGIWSALSIFETYAVFLRLGIVNGMNRELPFSLGKGDSISAFKYAETTLAYTLFDILLLLIVVPFIIWKSDFSDEYIVGICVSVVRVMMTFYITYLAATFRSDDNFDKLSNIQFLMLFIKLLLCPLVLLGFNGFLIYELLMVVFNVLLLHQFRPFKALKPKFHKIEFIQLFKIGFPVFLSSYIISFIDTVPRLFIIKYSNEKMLGLYAPVIMLLGTMSILPNTLSTYLYPKFSFNLGKSNNPRDIFTKLLKIYAVSFVVILVLVTIGFFLLDYFIVFFPKYTGSLPYLKLALLICPFVFFRLGNMFNVVIKKYSYMFAFVIIYGITQFLSLYMLSIYISDVLDIVIYSQIITSVVILIISILMNYMLIKNIEKVSLI
jgi:O-antigen/teichoic acid export membrane protein